MYTTLFSAALLGSFAVTGVLAQSTFVLHTPKDVNACQPVQIGWTDGKGPKFDLIAVPSDKPCEETLAQIPTTDGVWHATWTPDASLVGHQVVLSVQDEDEDEAWSEAFTIGPCSAASASVSSSAAGSSASASGAGAGATLRATSTSATGTGVVKGVENAAPSESAAGNASPVGAAGAGIGGSSKPSSAGSVRGTSAVVLGAIGAALVFAL